MIWEAIEYPVGGMLAGAIRDHEADDTLDIVFGSQQEADRFLEWLNDNIVEIADQFFESISTGGSTCPTCSGSGDSRGTMFVCRTCQGKGQV